LNKTKFIFKHLYQESIFIIHTRHGRYR